MDETKDRFPEVKKGDKVRKVKNLGWLLRHWQEVDAISVIEWGEGGAFMVAWLSTGKGDYYAATWASATVCRAWLARPVFFGLPLVWMGQHTTC